MKLSKFRFGIWLAMRLLRQRGYGYVSVDKASSGRFGFNSALLAILMLGAVRECIAFQPIVIEAQTKYNVSQRPDIPQMREYFREATWPIPDSAVSLKLLEPLRISKARLISIESRNGIRVDPDTNAVYFDFTDGALGTQLDNCKAKNLIPHIVVGQYPQTALLKVGANGGKYGISDWGVYEDYAHAFLEFVTVEHGIAQVDFEVANEPDVNGQTWLLGESAWNASPKMYDEYLKLYAAWANAADKLAREHPELNFRIGGPAIGPYSFGFGKLNWADQFLSDVANRKLRLDFFSFHFYGLNQPLTGLPKFGRYPSIDEFSSHVHDTLSRVGLEHVPIFFSEWGVHYGTETARGIINGTNVGAAWTARFLLDATESGIEEGALLSFIDHQVPPEFVENNWKWASFLHQDGGAPKPLHSVATMVTKLPDQRVKTVPVRNGSIGVVAGANSSEVAAIVFNQNWDFLNARELSIPEQTQITIRNLPFKASKVTVIKSVIDETRANPYLVELNNSLNRASVLNAKTLRAVRLPQIPVTNGTVVLPVTDLAPSSVTLWEILPVE